MTTATERKKMVLSIVILAISSATAWGLSTDSGETYGTSRTRDAVVAQIQPAAMVVAATAEGEASVHVVLGRHQRQEFYRAAPLEAGHPYKARVVVDRLMPDAEYEYRVWLEREEHGRVVVARRLSGSFRTAP